MIVEGASWTKHTGRTTPGVKLSLDSPLLLRTQGGEHEIRLTAHDRTTGLLDFVALDSIKDESGDLVMSFRWLIQRVLNWLERRGACITWPPNTVARTPPQIDALPDADEQKIKACRVILDSAVSYIWGPPGTGKTSHVLAPVVNACARAGEKVLVLAPTNLAVDNALDAVLGIIADPCSVLRLGIPTSGFLERWPQCCESKAHREQLAEIEELIEHASSRKAALEAQVRRLACLSAAESERVRKADELQVFTERLDSLSARQQHLEAEIFSAQISLISSQANPLIYIVS